MDVQFKRFTDVRALLPWSHVNPMWDHEVVHHWINGLDKFSADYGLVKQYLSDLSEAEVCLVDGLPYTCNLSAYLGQPSSWLVDCSYCAGQRMPLDQLEVAVRRSATRWKTSVDVPAILGQPGDLKTKTCHFDQPFKSKQRNEQNQALKLHEGYTLEVVPEVPHDFMCQSVDYWLSQGANPVSSITAHCWSTACAREGRGWLFKFQSPLGLAYVGITNIGRDLIFNTFFQSLNRPSRIGTAALTAAVNWLRDNHQDHRFMYLDSPRWGEDTSYAVYKSHLSNGEEKVGSMFAFHPTARTQTHYCEEHQAWI